MPSANGANLIRKANPVSCAERIQRFYEQQLNPYLNLHRPCGQADVEMLPNGERIRRYKRYRTPLETLLALDAASQYLTSEITAESLRISARTHSDTEAAKVMQEVKRKLFNELHRTA